MYPEGIYSTKNGLKLRVRLAMPADYDCAIKTYGNVASELSYLNTETIRPNIKEVWTERWVNNGEKTLFAIAELSGKIVGGIVLTDFSNSPKTDHVRDLGMWVVKEYRELGIGKAMMDYAIGFAKNNGKIKKIELGVWSTNHRALGLYLKMGFHVEGARIGVAKIFDDYVDEILMGLDIK